MMSDHPTALSSARAGAPASRSFRSLKLAWTDADSGEQFIVSLRGGAQMLGGLQKAGFELIDEPASAESRPAQRAAGEAPPHGAR